MADTLNDPATRKGADREAREVGTHDDALQRRIEILDSQSQRYKGRKESIRQLNKARREDEGANLRVQ
jgi:hypothetical protein